jgi:hypothetical protein
MCNGQTLPLCRHASWLNQIEIWFSILLRKLLRRGNFAKKELRTRSSSSSPASTQPWQTFRWTMAAKPLTD